MPISRANKQSEIFKTNGRHAIVCQETTLVELKSIYGISDIRDTVVEVGTGAVTNTVGDGEYRLTGSASGDEAILSSAEVGRYVPGFDALAGIGIRIPTMPTGDQYIQWGLYDDNDGFYFGVDATSLYVATLRNGVETKVRRSEWIDPLDGTGPSGITLDLAKGNIFNIQFAWYGYGPAEYRFNIVDGTNRTVPVIVRRYSASEQTSVRNPNLPIRAEVQSGTTAGELNCYMGGRRYSVLGEYNPSFRITGEEILQKGSIGTSYVPIISIQRKAAYAPSSIKINKVSIQADANMMLRLVYNPSLTGASYSGFSGIPATETALERDVSATALTGGQVIWRDTIAGGSNLRSSFSYGIDLPIIDLPQNGVFTLAARTVSANSGTLTAVASYREEW